MAVSVVGGLGLSPPVWQLQRNTSHGMSMRTTWLSIHSGHWRLTAPPHTSSVPPPLLRTTFDLGQSGIWSPTPHTGKEVWVCSLYIHPSLTNTYWHIGTNGCKHLRSHTHTAQQTGSDVAMHAKIRAIGAFAVTAKGLWQPLKYLHHSLTQNNGKINSNYYWKYLQLGSISFMVDVQAMVLCCL